MTNVAILVGNTHYDTLSTLQCCADDLAAIKELLKATDKYEEIHTIKNADADSLKTQMRTALNDTQSVRELFFYFTGHGHQNDNDFYFCATNFDGRRPNETGLSTDELHTLLRLSKADLIVKVVDACNSGTILVKADLGQALLDKGGFNNLVQISSCLDTQISLTGDPLSLFTDKFRAAALRKAEGVVYYTDIINTLRDEFRENNSQTPFFVAQGTGREAFLDDATKLNELRLKLKKIAEEHHAALASSSQEEVPMTLLDRLAAADSKVVTPEILRTFVDGIFDRLEEKIFKSECAEFFEIEFIEHSDYQESTAERFIVQSLANEKRPDNFVTATRDRVLRESETGAGSRGMASLLRDGLFEERYHLSLNCKMSRAQVCIMLTPKFINLQRIKLVVSCAPSLDRCYLFEVVTQHRLRDFDDFDPRGTSISRRWWKLSWFESPDDVVAQIAQVLSEAVEGHLVSAEQRLSEAGSKAQ